MRLWTGLNFALCLFALFVAAEQSVSIRRRVYDVARLVSLFFIPMTITFLINAHALDVWDFAEYQRILYYILLILVGAVAGKGCSISTLRKFFVALLALQVVTAFAQIFSMREIIKYFALIWDFSKGRHWRATGSFANPNRLAFFTLLFGSFVYFSAPKKALILERAFGLLAVGVLLIFASSKFGLLIFLLGILIMVLRNSLSWKNLPVAVLLLLFLLGIPWLISDLGKYFLYLRPISELISGNPLALFTSSSFIGRFLIWGNLFEVWWKADWVFKVFGLGPSKGFGIRTADNELIFLMFRYGIFGFISYLSIWVLLALKLAHAKINTDMKKILLVYLCLLFSMTLVGDALSSWVLPPAFFCLLGCALNSQDAPDDRQHTSTPKSI